jgi:hypothetical protein
MFERAKTFHALDRAATLIGSQEICQFCEVIIYSRRNCVCYLEPPSHTQNKTVSSLQRHGQVVYGDSNSGVVALLQCSHSARRVWILVTDSDCLRFLRSSRFIASQFLITPLIISGLEVNCLAEWCFTIAGAITKTLVQIHPVPRTSPHQDSLQFSF